MLLLVPRRAVIHSSGIPASGPSRPPAGRILGNAGTDALEKWCPKPLQLTNYQQLTRRLFCMRPCAEMLAHAANPHFMLVFR